MTTKSKLTLADLGSAIEADTPEAMRAEIATLKTEARRREREFDQAVKAAGVVTQKQKDRLAEMKIEADVYRAQIATLTDAAKAADVVATTAAEAGFVRGIAESLHKMKAVSDLLEIPARSENSRAGSMHGQDQGLETRDHYTLGKARFAMRGLLYAVEGMFNDRTRPGRPTEYGSVNTLAYAQRQLDLLAEAKNPESEMEIGQRKVLIDRDMEIEVAHFMATAFHEDIAAPIHAFVCGLYAEATGEDVASVLADMRKRNAPEKPPAKGANVSAEALRLAMGK